MECERFEQYLSDFIEGTSPPHQAEALACHARVCEACGETLRGVRHARMSLRRLARQEPGPAFKLRLSGSLLESQQRRRHGRAMSLAVAFVLVLAALLWPASSPPPTPVALLPGVDGFDLRAAPMHSDELAGVWQVQFSELARRAPYSLPRGGTVSFASQR